MQNQASGSTTEQAAPRVQRQHRVAKHQLWNSQRIRVVQQQLKSEGLFKGRITGKMDRQTRLAMARFQQERRGMGGHQMALSGSSMQRTHTAHLGKQRIHTAHMARHAPKTQATGIGSSSPNAGNANAPITPPAASNAPAGAGGNTSTGTTQPTTGTTTPPAPSPNK